jgi:nitrogen-specific signal transduction histidine kinase/pSer/pThr/pTyr-binding forkhead associated (FHA) protein
LIVIKGTDEGKQFDLEGGPVGVGRDSSNPVRLHDTEVSRRHAEFRRASSGGYNLVDIGSANGTYVNNQPVKETILQSGDHIQIGQTVLVYSAGRRNAAAEIDLADRISMITRQDLELSSAIIKRVAEGEGSRILAKPEEAETPWLKTALANLQIMYEAIHTISHIVDLDQLLERIMDLILSSIDADHGCIMLRHPETGQFEPKAVRWRHLTNTNEKMALSRTVMDYVLREKQGILVSDAASDERFNAGQSIVRFGIREVICVPMKGRHETLGVLYLDTHCSPREMVASNSPTGKFNEDHLMLAIAIAHQAALAVEDTRYHQAMVHAERLAAIGQAVASLSHHIKNILQGLRSGSEILKLGLTDKDDALLQQGWRIVEKNQGKIYDLVMDMLSYSKEREPAIENTNVNRVIRDVLELVQGRIQDAHINLETRLAADLPLAPADPEGLHRSVLNIVTNAIEAVEDSKTAHIAVATSLESDGAWVRITVLDNGVGIPLQNQPDIFKPFVSTKGAKGTGLGLAVSRKILREHGGDILLQSQPGKGSKFVLRLPLKSPLSVDPSAPGEKEPVLAPPTET